MSLDRLSTTAYVSSFVSGVRILKDFLVYYEIFKVNPTKFTNIENILKMETLDRKMFLIPVF